MRQQLTAILSLWFSLSTLRVEASGAGCSQIQDLQNSAQAASPSVLPVAIPIKATLDCLQNISQGYIRPDASAMIDQMFKYLEWQTDLADLKDPPSDYPYPPHDLKAKLADVKAKVDNKTYASEYDFEVDMFENVFAPAHSGHLVFYPDLLTTPWAWTRRVSLVSISSDGTALPEIFFHDDIISSPSTASPLTKINGIDSVEYIEDLVFRTASQDPDAGYNAMFYGQAYVAAKISNGGYFAAGGRPSDVYPGENTTYTFQNGTTVTYDNVALLKWNFTGVADNRIFVARYRGSVDRFDTPIAFPWDQAGYPTAVVASSDNLISGHYLSEDGLDDVAVLSVLSFEPSSVAEFQAVAETFLADAVRDGKRKLVVDLTANNGGYILSAYDLFRQLFPQTEQVGYSRYRENEILLTFTNISKKVVPDNYDPKNATQNQIQAYETSYDYRYDLNTSGQHFPSYDAKFAPNPYRGSNFSALQSWDLNDPLTTTDSTYGFGIEITGYGTRKNFTQPFAAEDIILLYDGFCASSCGLFSDFARNQGGAKSIVVGGRPSANPMQGVGGVRGGLLATWTDLYEEVIHNMRLAIDQDYDFLVENRPDVTPLGWSSVAGMNIRDVILPNHVEDGLPAQYVTENADCRLFYTKDMILDVTKTWNAAAEAAFNGGKCVVGSLPKRDTTGSPRREKRVPHGPSAPRKTKRVQVNKETVTKDAAWHLKHGRKALE